MKTRFNRCGPIAITLAASLAGCGAFQLPTGVTGPTATVHRSQSYDFRILYRFKGAVYGDGSDPESSLIAVKDELYGTTVAGGNYNYSACGGGEFFTGCGTVYKISLSGGEHVLYRFEGGSDGYSPSAGLVALNGMLYGTTSNGGSAACEKAAHEKSARRPCGIVFALSPSGTERVLHRFAGHPDGAGPSSLIAVNGALYGTTEHGGRRDTCGVRFGCGVVFGISTSGTERLLYAFKGRTDGAIPAGPLLAVNGTLYGTTLLGGASSDECGTVFKISTSGIESVLYRFNDTQGCYPVGGLVQLKGKLYGITRYGVVYELSLSGKEQRIYTFGDHTQITAQLIAYRDALYGVSASGGTAGCGSFGCGFIFKVTTSGEEQTLYEFRTAASANGALAPLLPFKGTLFGTTASGGAYSCFSSNYGCGTVFEVQP